MKKRIIAVLLLLGVSATMCVSAFAETAPIITWGEREICLDRPEGEFVNGVFVAPVRRICELAGASVDWYESNQGIIINTKDNLTRIFLYIGNDTLRVFKFTSIADGIGEDSPLDAPLKLVDGRTLVPFEQLCIALDLEYEWNEDKSSVAVKPLEEIGEEERFGMSISVDKEDVSEGDEVTVSVIASSFDLYSGKGYGGYSAGLIYNSEEFQLVSSCLTTSTGEKIDGAIGAENSEFTNDSLKVAYVTIDKLAAVDGKAIVGRIVLKSLTDNGGTIALSNRISTVGYDTSIVLNDIETSDTLVLQKDTELKIDTTPVVIK